MTKLQICKWKLVLATALFFGLASSTFVIATDNVDCTIYYTPREIGFTLQRGFNLELDTRPGLKDRRFATDFLRAVQMEGHGRLAQPYDGFRYIYYNGKWGYTDYPKGTMQLPLIPLQSCAISSASGHLKPGTWLRAMHDSLPSVLQNRWWKICDVGGGVQTRQIDFYWGEDNPRGPGHRIYQPAGISFTGARNATLFLSSTNPKHRNPL